LPPANWELFGGGNGFFLLLYLLALLYLLLLVCLRVLVYKVNCDGGRRATCHGPDDCAERAASQHSHNRAADRAQQSAFFGIACHIPLTLLLCCHRLSPFSPTGTFLQRHSFDDSSNAAVPSARLDESIG